MLETRESRVLFVKILIASVFVVVIIHLVILLLIYGFSNPLGDDKVLIHYSLRSLISPFDDLGLIIDLPRFSRWIDPLMWIPLALFLYPIVLIRRGEDMFFNSVLIWATLSVVQGILLGGLIGGIAVFVVANVYNLILSLPFLILIWLVLLFQKIIES